MESRSRFYALASLLLAMLGCAATGERECRNGFDCASGACSAEGRCIDSSGNGGGSIATGGGTGGDGGAGGDGGEALVGGGAPSCQPNADGMVTQAEVPLMAGLSAKLLATQDASFNTGGSQLGDGSRLWDFSGALAGDHLTVVETLALEGRWFSGSFAGASYAARLSDGQDLLGVFEIAQDALLLRGVVSPSAGATRTELIHDPPVMVLSFPLSVGKTWATTSTVTGLAQGVAVFYSEAYAYDVDADGQALTPFADFDVQRVHVELVRTIAGFPTVVQSHAFVSECFGVVANVMSQDHETATDFSNVAELRRLAP